MAPSKAAVANSPFAKDERVLCFHHDMLYEAKILDVRKAEEKDAEQHTWKYKIHYKGWKNTWDDWVLQDRVRKFSEENKELAAQLHNQLKDAKHGKGSKKRTQGSDFSSARGSEERHASTAAQGGRGAASRRNRDYDLDNEDTFHAKPMVQLPVPDHIKAILVDDWENVTKNQQLVPLPAKVSVTVILDDYVEYESGRRLTGTPQSDLLPEVVTGLKEYFEKCLGRVLLYRFERSQYQEVREGLSAKEGDYAGKMICDIYGAEHLCRLIVSLPELIAQTNMDTQSVNRLREELTKLTMWLGKNAPKYFNNEYETPGAEYIEKARSG